MSHDHRPDGRLRLAAALLIGIAAAATRSVDVLAVMLLASLGAALIASRRLALSLSDLGKRLLIANSLVIGVWLTVPVNWRTLSLDESGIDLALQISLRINLIIITVSLLLQRMSGLDLARAAAGLGLPRSLSALLAFAVRMVGLLGDTRARLDQAMRARAYRPAFSWRTIRVSAQLVAWLIVHALVRSERITLGLRARGLATLHASALRPSPWHSIPLAEWRLLLAIVAAIGVAMALPLLWN